MKSFKLLIIASLTSTVIGCEQKEEMQISSTPIPLQMVTEEFPYEVYTPADSSNVLSEFEESSIYIFDSQNASDYTPINKSIWVIEGNLNAFYGDSTYQEEDTIIYLNNTYTFELNSNEEIINADIASNFSSAYDEIANTLSNNDGYSYNITDVRVSIISSGEITLLFSTSFLVNATSVSSYSWPNVPPASISRRAGTNADCNSITGKGAWKHVQWQARQTLPSLLFPVNYNFRRPRYNVVTFSSNIGQISQRYFDGSWMLGHADAIFTVHQNPVPVANCVTPQQQDAYSQRLSDDLYDIVLKRTYWDGVSSLRVLNGAILGTTRWEFDGILSKNINANLNANYGPQSLGLN